MVTSDTATFSLDILEIIEEAHERAGLEVRTGYELSTARRSLNLLLIEWMNRGINLWTVDQRSLDLVRGQVSYVLDADIIDLLDHVIRLPTGLGTANQIDYKITRTSVITYSTRTNKLVESRPTEIYVDRQRDAPEVTMWPVPDNDNYQLIYWCMRRIQDIGEYTNTADLPFRFLDALIAGLAYRIAMKKPEALPRIQDLKGSYEECFRYAAEQDREKADSRFVPHMRFRV